MIYHIYKTDCNKSSRVLMQSRWDSAFSFIHLSSNAYTEPHLKLEWKNLFSVAFRMGEKDCMVFHAQSSLPYLLLAFLVKNIFFLKGRYVYDIHDYHELSPKTKILSREFFRYIVFFVFEYIIFKFKKIPIFNIAFIP